MLVLHKLNLRLNAGNDNELLEKMLLQKLKDMCNAFVEVQSLVFDIAPYFIYLKQ